MAFMYCPNCKTNTITERDHFSLLLAFLLAFTGLGLVIYILYHLDKKKDRCVHCGVKCLPKQPDTIQNTVIYPLQNGSNQLLQFKSNEPPKSKVNFCHNCGTDLGEREDIKFCALCGSSLD
jgi:hypothetical protein